MIITIDGPVASGKSTVAIGLARSLNIYYLNTGFLYRSLAYILKKEFNYILDNFNKPNREDIKFILGSNNFSYSYDTVFFERIFWKEEDITPFLKTDEIDNYSSIISANKFVREELLNFQRKFAKKYDIVADGRDCGTVVFPNAGFKFFITADLEKRAKRWKNFQEQKGNSYTLEQAKDIIIERDKRDMEREISPLKKAEDAITIDNSNLNIEETLKKVLSYIIL